MNENDIQKILALVMGLFTGAGLTYTFVKAKYEKMLDKEISEFKEYHLKRGKLSEFTVETIGHTRDDPLINASPLPVASEEYGELIAKIESEGYSVTDVPVISTVEKDEPEADDELELYVEGQRLTEARLEGLRTPFVITFEEYAHTQQHFDKGTLSYYKEDDILADSTDEVIPDMGMVVGAAGLELLRDSTFLEVIYIRNAHTATDYEITQEAGSFAELVLGESPPGD